jgi:hypothetical protein
MSLAHLKEYGVIQNCLVKNSWILFQIILGKYGYFDGSWLVERCFTVQAIEELLREMTTLLSLKWMA